VVTCDLTTEDPACSARAVIGPYARTFYVSRDAVYVWVGAGYESWKADKTRDAADTDRSYVYRMPLDGGEVTAIRARGNPIDQFSFKQAADDVLHVVVSSDGQGDAMFQPEVNQGTLALLQVPLASFSATPAVAPPSAYTVLLDPAPSATKGGAYYGSTGVLQNRFVAGHLLWGSGLGWGNGTTTSQKVFALALNEPAQQVEVALSHGVDRIEPMGAAAMVVGSDGSSLGFSALELGASPAVRGTYRIANSAQGESRSHGFFYLPDEQGGGTLGLPVRTNGATYYQLFSGSAEVHFLHVDAALSLTNLGALTAHPTQARDDTCKVSCVDWYGNARPIFHRSRVYALMGYELVEGSLSSSAITEAQRVDFTP
jgi:hypothetical protein